jgi:hypothetical protein
MKMVGVEIRSGRLSDLKYGDAISFAIALKNKYPSMTYTEIAAKTREKFPKSNAAKNLIWYWCNNTIHNPGKLDGYGPQNQNRGKE